MRSDLTKTTLATIAVLASVQNSAGFSSAAISAAVRETNSLSVLCAANNDDQYKSKEKKGFFANFFDELDAFVDDATSRRLGNGAQYYGKRKSGFYGKDDASRKKNKSVSDPTEDYRGPSNAGYFKWIPDPETGELKPVTRLKEQNIERKSRM